MAAGTMTSLRPWKAHTGTCIRSRGRAPPAGATAAQAAKTPVVAAAAPEPPIVTCHVEPRRSSASRPWNHECATSSGAQPRPLRRRRRMRQRVDGVAFFKRDWRRAGGAFRMDRPRCCRIRRRRAGTVAAATGPAQRFVEQRFVGLRVFDLLEMLPGHGWCQEAEQPRRTMAARLPLYDHSNTRCRGQRCRAAERRARVTGALDAQS